MSESTRPLGVSARDGGGAAESWIAAALKALLLLVLSVGGFVLLPDLVATKLPADLPPRTHDAIVVAIVVVAFIILSWLFVRLQPRRKPER
jgi:membrane protein implicated in regulation of membrane protease activity